MEELSENSIKKKTFYFATICFIILQSLVVVKDFFDIKMTHNDDLITFKFFLYDSVIKLLMT